MVGDRCELLEPLGRGGFGTVYRARLHGPAGSRAVVVKLLNPEQAASPDAVRRLRDEARILAHVRHPAVVRAEGLLQLGERWGLVMELLEGCTLAAALADGPMPLAPVLQLTAQIAGALAAGWAGDRGDGQPLRLLHRDIKPANIFLTADGGVRLLDFGIARAQVDGREAQTTAILYGSPAYTAPERYDGTDGPAGDIYSLGCVLFEALVGAAVGRTSANPATHADLWADAMQRAAGAGVPSTVLGLLGEMLAGDPGDRPDAQAVALRCDALLAPGGGLLSWAHHHIPARSAAPSPAVSETIDPDLLAPPRPPRPARWLVLPLLGAAAIGLGVAASPLLAPTAPPDPAPIRTAPVPEPLPEPASVQAPAVVPVPEPEPEPEPVPQPVFASISVTGAERVELRGARTHALPGEVPAGEYQIWAGGVPCGMVTVRAGDRFTLDVNPVFSTHKVLR